VYVAPPFFVYVDGPSACFTNPVLKRDTATYRFLVPTAADGILRGIYWKPQFEYLIEEVYIHSLVSEVSEKVNELKNTPALSSILASGFLVGAGSTNTTQRTRTFLVNPSYTIKVRIVARDRDNASKHYNILRSRIERGSFHRLDLHFGAHPHMVHTIRMVEPANIRPAVDWTAEQPPCVYKWLFSVGEKKREGYLAHQKTQVVGGRVDFSTTMSQWLEGTDDSFLS